MSTLDTIAIWLAGILIVYLVVGADLAFVHSATDASSSYFAEAKATLDITVVEDSWAAIRGLMETGHEALGDGAEGMFESTQ